MRDAWRGALLGLAALAVLGALASRAGWLVFDLPRPAGTGPWLVARASGFAALAALGMEVVLGLLLATRLTDRWLARGDAVALHGWLSPIAVALIAGHAAVLLADRFVRFDVLDVTLPFVAPVRAGALAVGILAGYAALVVHVSFALRRRLGAATWRRLHGLSFAAFAGALLHAALAGTDVGRPWAIALLAAITAPVLALGLRRATAARTAPSSRAPGP